VANFVGVGERTFKKAEDRQIKLAGTRPNNDTLASFDAKVMLKLNQIFKDRNTIRKSTITRKDCKRKY
jgi:hypothetical protein